MITSFFRAVLAAGLIVMSSSAVAQNILLLNEACRGSAEYGPQALSNLGLSATTTTDWVAFSAALTDGTTWDLVIVDSYNDSDDATAAELANYIDSGGLTFIAFWRLGSYPDVATAMNATVISNYDPPIPINAWVSGDQLFTAPNAAAGPWAPIADTCNIDGQRLEPTAGGTALAGYTASATANEAAIISGNGGDTIVFGFTPGLFDADMVPLYENAIQSLLASVAPSVAVPVPTNSPLGTLLLVISLMMLGLMGLRQRFLRSIEH